MNKLTRTPSPVHVSGSRTQKPNDTYLLRFNHLNVSFLKSLNFVTPTPEELAKAEEEKSNKLVDDVTKKVTESVEKKWQAKYDSLAAELRKSKEPEKTDDEKDKDKPAPKSKADKEIDERLKRVEEKDGKVTKKALRNGVRTALFEVGHTTDTVIDALDLFMLREAANLEYDDDSDEVKYKHGDDSTSVTKYIKDTKEMKRYHRAKQTPKVSPSSGPAASGDDGTIEMSPAEFAQAQRDGTKMNLSKVKLKV